MSSSIPPATLEKFTTFGDLLRYLRRRVGMTQVELSIAVGYSEPQISRLEQNLRLPDIPTIEARFIAPLGLEDEPVAFARLIELAATVRREDAPASGLCPYKGLDYFDETDADLFVGREALTNKMVGDILALASTDQADQIRLFTIVGASGSGKSSLVRAGLVPALRWNKTSSNWPMYISTPTAHPLESLANSLTRQTGSIAVSARLMDDLARESRTLSLYIHREIKITPGSYILLVIDQFEELFAQCRSEEERSAYIDNLVNAVSDPEGKVIVIIALRADFYAQCAIYPHLRQALAKDQEYIGAMSDEEMRRAVEEPAQRGHWEFEASLVDLILHDVGHEPGALPLLSHALFETWQRRHGRTLTLSGYTAAGGVRGAIAETAESVFADQFSSKQKAIARRIFLRLTELGDEKATGDTRRQATIEELILRQEESDATLAVLKTLADARLITTGEDSVQVAHEALIREWPTLRGWLEENREGLRLHRQLTVAAQEWLITAHEPDMLYRGLRLAQAREWANAHVDEMNPLEKEFLDASIASSEQEATERENARQHELETAQKLADTERQRAQESVKSARRLRQHVILSSAIGVVAVLMAILAIIAWRRSASQAEITLSLSLAAAAQQANLSGQGDLALALALESINTAEAPPTEAISALRSVALSTGTRFIVRTHSQAVRSLAFSPDAKTAFSGSCAQIDDQGACSQGELILWNLVSGQVLHRWMAHSGWVYAVAFSLDGQMLISGGQDGSLIIWDLDGKQLNPPINLGSTITGLEVIARSGNLLTSTADGSLILWNLKTGEVLRRFEGISSPITALAAAAEVSVAVTTHQDRSLVLWSLDDSQPLQRLPDQGAGINAIAINADASQIFFTTGKQPYLYLRQIDSHSGKVLNEQTFGCLPQHLALSPDETYLLISCEKIIVQWGIANWRERANLVGHVEQVTTMDISRDGRMALSASKDGSIRVWNLGDQLDYQIYDIPVDHLSAIAVSSSGKYLLLNDAVINGYDQPALWDTNQKEVIKTYPDFKGVISPGAVSISPDNRFVAAGGLLMDKSAPTLMLWDLETGAQPCQFHGYLAPVSAVAFSPDSRYLLAGSQDPETRSGDLLLWDLQTCWLDEQFDTDEDVTSIKFSADGARVITGSRFHGRVILWEVASGLEMKQFPYIDYGPVFGVAFGPGESSILGSAMTDLYLWDVESANIVRHFIGHSPFPWGVDISSDGRYALSGAQNGDVILWDFTTGVLLHRINLVEPVYSVAFSPDSSIAYAASEDGKLLEWQVAEKELPELLNWINANRNVRELTCAEKLQYHVSDPACNP